MSWLLDQMSDKIYHYVDFLWIPVAWFVVEKRHRWNTLAFVAACLITLRAQVVLMTGTGYETGFLPLMHSHIYPRGAIIYSIVITLFLILAHYSPRTSGIIFFAAALNLYILTFCVSMLLMAL